MKRTTALDYLYLGSYRLFRGFVLYTPESIRFAILKGLAHLAYLIDRRHRHVAFVNLDIAFGDTMSEKEKKRIVKKSYENLLFLLHEIVLNQGISKEEMMKKVSFAGEEHIEAAHKAGKPIIFVAAHYGIWELAPLAYGAKYGPVTVVGRPLDSRAMNDILTRHRRQLNVTLIEKKGALKHLITALKKGEAVGLLVDQNTARHDGIVVDFFGKPARHTPAAAILARRLDAVVLPIFIESDDYKHYTLKVYPPLAMEKSDNPDEDIRRHVQAQADITEHAVRERPDHWFWLHKRWRKEAGVDYQKRRAI